MPRWNVDGFLAEAQNFTRDFVNEPSNRMTPALLARAAQDMAERFGLDCRVLETD